MSFLRFFGFLGLLLLSLEGFLRAVIITPFRLYPDPHYCGQRLAGDPYVESREGFQRHATDSMGLITHRSKTIHPRTRVLILGDSESEARQVPAQATFPAVADDFLPDVQITNASHSGWTYYESLPYLRENMKTLRPDIVVLQFSGRPPVESHEICQGPLRRSTTLRPHQRLIRFFTRHSSLAAMTMQRLTLILKAEKSRLQAKFGHVPSVIEGKRDLVRGRHELVKAVRAIEALGPKVLVVRVPKVEYSLSRCAPNDHEVSKMLSETAVEEGLTVIDPTVEFCREYLRTAQPPVGFHNGQRFIGHLNVRGHRIVGKLLAEAIVLMQP